MRKESLFLCAIFGCAAVSLVSLLVYRHLRVNSRLQESNKAGSDAEMYDVYSEAIRALYLQDNGGATKSSDAIAGGSGEKRLVVIKDHTISEKGSIPDNGIGGVRLGKIPLDQDTIRDFHRKNSDSIPLEPRFTFATGQVLVSDHELGSILSEDSWAEFYKRYPTSAGYILLSRVGFNREHNEALLYIARLCGSSCGEGFCVKLHKVGAAWYLKQESGQWYYPAAQREGRHLKSAS